MLRDEILLHERMFRITGITPKVILNRNMLAVQMCTPNVWLEVALTTSMLELLSEITTNQKKTFAKPTFSLVPRG